MYKITILKTAPEQVKSKEYRKIGEDDEGNAKYGYVEEEHTKDVERELYKQVVEDLDMTEVIKSINGMTEDV
jgi:hypothetical protein